MSYPTAQHDRMISDQVIKGYVVAVDLMAGRLRMTDGSDWLPARPAIGGRQAWASRAR